MTRIAKDVEVPRLSERRVARLMKRASKDFHKLRCEHCGKVNLGVKWHVNDCCPERFCEGEIYSDHGLDRSQWPFGNNCTDGNVCYGIPF
jgi:hypothetical protein